MRNLKRWVVKMRTKIARVLANCLDYFIIYYVCYFILWIVNQFLSTTFTDVIIGATLMIAIFLLFCFKDVLFGYESIGKKIMGLKIYDKKGNRVTDKRKLVKRVFHSTYTFPFYVIFVFVNNQTIGDKVCGTTVQMSH